jgi:hypothetical protein
MKRSGPSELIATTEAADILGLSVNGVNRRVRDRKLVPVIRGHGLRGPNFFDRAYIEGIAAREKADAHQLHDALADHDDVKAGA